MKSLNKTPIDWVKNPDGTQGYTWNPITGCLNQVGGMCKGGNFPCYAYGLANGRLKSRYLANSNIAPEGIDWTTNEVIVPTRYYSNPFYPRFWEDRLRELDPTISRPLKPRGIFVCDMGELFGQWLPIDWQEEILWVIKENPQHRFYLLTKQPQNLIKFSPFPDNCWVGVTVTSNSAMTLAMTNLVNVDAPTRFISFEPLLGQVGMNDHMSMKNVIDWVIIGAQTKPYKPPKIEWVEEITKACDKAGIPVFHKNNLKPIFPIPTNTLRQELPV